MRYLVAITVLLLAFEAGRLTSLPSVVAQTQSTTNSIRIDDVNLTLGMAEGQALSRFGAEYVLDPAGESARWIKKKPTDPNGKDYQILGSLTFANGRLSRVIKSWVADQQSIESFWNGLFGSISNAAGPQGSKATVLTKETSQPNMNTRLIVLTLEGRSIQIARVEQYQNPKVTAFSVDETFPPLPN
jgi:hypothetical protein